VYHLNTLHWPYQIEINCFDDEILLWCVETLGNRFTEWYSYDIAYSIDYVKRLYAFRHEEDLLLFKLRWSNI
jgi:hypothetical protein